MNWLDHLCAFYLEVTGDEDEERLARVRLEGQFSFEERRSFIVTWEPLDRELKSRESYRYAWLPDGGKYATPVSVAIPGGPIYTQIICKLPHYHSRKLNMAARKPFFGKGWKWRIDSDLPEQTIKQIQRLMLELERPDLYRIHLSSGKSYDRLVVETAVLRGNGSNFRIDTEYELFDEGGRLLSVDDSTRVIFGKLLALVRKAADILDP